MAKKGFKLTGADMSRDTSLAGKTVSKGRYNITYDDLGYATTASNYRHGLFSGTDRSVAAPSADTVKSTADRGGYGGSSYDQSHFTDSELQQAAELRARATSGQIPWSAAHDFVERVRGKYGYSGGDDGRRYIRSDLTPWNPNGDADGDGAGSHGGGTLRGSSILYSGGGGGFSYGGAPGYVNRYQSGIDALTQQILGRAAFSYDPEQDPTWQQYRESYTRGGQRAMQDTMAQMASRTGGLASSYAGSVAQQSYDSYMSALADKIPELRQLAYSMYRDEGNDMRSNLDMLIALEQGDYAKAVDQLDQYNTDRNFDYNAYRDSVGDQRYADEWAYQLGRDQLSDLRYDSERADEQALARAQMLASIGDFSGYAALGYSDADIAKLQSAYNRAQAAVMLKGRRIGDDSSDSGTQNYSGLFNAARDSGHPKSYIANNYKDYGFTSSSGLYDDFAAWDEDQSGKGTDGGISAGAETLRRQLLGIPGLTEDNKVSIIEDALNGGRITEEDSAWLLDYLGHR